MVGGIYIYSIMHFYKAAIWVCNTLFCVKFDRTNAFIGNLYNIYFKAREKPSKCAHIFLVYNINMSSTEKCRKGYSKSGWEI